MNWRAGHEGRSDYWADAATKVASRCFSAAAATFLHRRPRRWLMAAPLIHGRAADWWPRRWLMAAPLIDGRATAQRIRQLDIGDLELVEFSVHFDDDSASALYYCIYVYLWLFRGMVAWLFRGMMEWLFRGMMGANRAAAHRKAATAVNLSLSGYWILNNW